MADIDPAMLTDVWHQSMVGIPVSIIDSDFSPSEVVSVRALAYYLTPKVAFGELDPQSTGFFTEVRALLAENQVHLSRLEDITGHEKLGGLLLEACLRAKFWGADRND